ncbi:unnamed protein product [Bursaphelenchus xylophilus]|uniref:(pine wood nematode) hypothetical protein n=1 Tax=Bursaphelenchus xylophilus TaxID=6326 RepID=A0A1I7RVU6_BURXY|nr:unnamed protein product [Bursaphelenchus xylophilus]CAG9082196.1 unnamed protein product [Bursaphelenchus xylophilus]
MCKAAILKAIFVVGLVASLILTLAGFYLPRWEAMPDANGTIQTKGLWKNCIQDTVQQTQERVENQESVEGIHEACKSVFESSENYIKLCIFILALSLALQLAALVWSIFSFFACCCPGLFGLIGILTALAGISDLASVGVYYFSANQDWAEQLEKTKQAYHTYSNATLDEDLTFINRDTASLFLVSFAGVLLIVVTIVAVIVQMIFKKVPVP